jgi:hypothetical protein
MLQAAATEAAAAAWPVSTMCMGCLVQTMHTPIAVRALSRAKSRQLPAPYCAACTMRLSAARVVRALICATSKLYAGVTVSS